MKIKTIRMQLDYSEDFDKAVNKALAEGWILVKREVLPAYVETTAVMLVAELRRHEASDYKKPFNIKVKYFDKTLEPLEKITVGDWIDLRSAETVELKAGEYKLLRLGIGMILPDGFEAHVLPRSSTPGKFGIVLANGMGVIDNSYSGDADEWHFPAVAIRDTVIKKGDRIAQFRLVKNQPSISFETVDHLNADSRGGIGSTGER